MTEETSSERLAKVNFEVEVLKQLGIMSYQLKLATDYQNACDTRANAHGIRISNVENILAAFQKYGERIKELEDIVANLNTARKTLMWFSGILFVLAGFLVSLAALVIHHG